MAGAGARDGLVSESEVREKNVAGGTFNGSQNDPVLIESVKIKLQCARERGGRAVVPPPSVIETPPSLSQTYLLELFLNDAQKHFF